jgi:peptidoglycan/xylan/chitin deacetylase (PgdA/CDA1 family)
MWLVLGIVLAVTALAVFGAEPRGILTAIEHSTPQLLYRVPTDRPLAALSFDDGPHPVFTPQVLDILEAHHAQATFFLIGERALRYPELVARIKNAGHEVGNHYFRNGSLLLHSDDRFLSNLAQTEMAIGLPEGPKLFRPPGGLALSRQLRLARSRGYTSVLGSAYPHDPLRPPVWYIRWLIKKNLAPGAIVILHDGIPDASRGILALPQILGDGAEKGLTFVSIGQLIARAL